MPVNILNLPGLNVLDFKETDDEYHVKASPLEISRRCPHCDRSDDTVSHAWRTLVIRDIPKPSLKTLKSKSLSTRKFMWSISTP